MYIYRHRFIYKHTISQAIILKPHQLENPPCFHVSVDMGKSNQLYYGNLWPPQDQSPVKKKSSKKKSLRQKSPTRPITHPNSNPVNYTLRVRGNSFLLVFSRRSRFTKWLGLEPKRQGPWRWRIDEKISSSPQGVPPFVPTFYRSIT